MSIALKDNMLYLKILPKFKQEPLQESLTCMQAFMLGLLANGFKAEDRTIMKHVVSFLNDEDPLSGSAIANVITLQIELERSLTEKNLALFIPLAKDKQSEESQEDFQRRTNQAIKDFALGLALSMIITPKGILKNSDLTKEDQEDLKLFYNFLELDEDSENDEEDLQTILDHFENFLLQRFQKNHQ